MWVRRFIPVFRAFVYRHWLNSEAAQAFGVQHKHVYEIQIYMHKSHLSLFFSLYLCHNICWNSFVCAIIIIAPQSSSEFEVGSKMKVNVRRIWICSFGRCDTMLLIRVAVLLLLLLLLVSAMGTEKRNGT